MNAQGMTPEKILDLRGKICPMTFVYMKVALEEVPESHP